MGQVRRIGKVDGVWDYVPKPEVLEGGNVWLLGAIVGLGGALVSSSDGGRMLFGGLGIASLVASLSGRSDIDVPDVPDGGGVDGRSVVVMVERLSIALLQNVSSGRCEVLEACFLLSDANFIAVANEFKRRNNTTVRRAIAALWYAGCDWGGKEYDELVVSRLDDLRVP